MLVLVSIQELTSSLWGIRILYLSALVRKVPLFCVLLTLTLLISPVHVIIKQMGLSQYSVNSIWSNGYYLIFVNVCWFKLFISIHFKRWPSLPGWCSSVDWARAANQRVASSVPSQGWVAGQVPRGVRERSCHTLMFLSLPLSLNK